MAYRGNLSRDQFEPNDIHRNIVKEEAENENRNKLKFGRRNISELILFYLLYKDDSVS